MHRDRLCPLTVLLISKQLELVHGELKGQSE